MKAERRTRTLEYLVYVTSDGKEFDSPKAAEKHEAELLPKRKFLVNIYVLILLMTLMFIKLNQKKIQNI